MNKIKRGHYCERQARVAVKELLADLGYVPELADVSSSEDIKGVDIKSVEGVSFQVKHQRKAAQTGNFSFELVQKRLSDGYQRDGNHWHDFDYYVMSTDCSLFYVFDPTNIDYLANAILDGEKYLPAGVKCRWNSPRTVKLSAKEWTNGVQWTALNLLVPISWVVDNCDVKEVRVRVR